MENNEKKKVLVPTIVAVVTLIALVAGATYAYFAVGTQNNFGTTNINATADNVGMVTLNKTGNGIYLNLSAVNMMKQYDNETPKDVTYYGVDDPNGSPLTSLNEITIGTASVTGEGYYTCTYSLTVEDATEENDMYTAFQNWKTNGYRVNEALVSPSSDATTGQIVLKVGETTYDFYDTNVFSKKATGTLTNIKSGTDGIIKASIYVKNDKDKNQNAIAGTEININVTVDSFSCTAVEEPPKPTYVYWTYETGQSNVTYATARPKYTEANKSQIPNDYYIKTTLTPTVATENVYEIQYDDNGEIGHYGQYVGLTSCEADMQDGATCVKLYSKGDTYDVPSTNEVCANIDGQEVCMEPNHWDTADTTYKAAFETAGWLCKYYDGDKNGEETNTKPSNGVLTCAATDPSNLSNDALFCEANSDNIVTCGVYEKIIDSCSVNPSGSATCE